MHSSPQCRNNKTAQAQYRKKSKKQKLDDFKTQYLQSIIKQLFEIKDDLINCTFKPNCYGFDLQ